ncbi:MAG: histidinol dehydrogenase [Verrucomicrobiales bacterium]|jgi:histidinol dehydrogenase
MRILSYKDEDFERARERFFVRRAEPTAPVKDLVGDVIEAVRRRGDAAVFQYAERFDRVELDPKTIVVTKRDLTAAEKKVEPSVKKALTASYKNVTAFAKASLREDWSMTNAQGAEIGEVFRPYQRVGCYVPGGTAPLVSTAIMTVAIAAAAGCKEIVVCTPCSQERKVDPNLLHALQMAGATEIYKIGGAQAVAAMALGTKTIAPVSKIFGPGNAFVVEAKRQLFGSVSIDLLPGPSEILILADTSANPKWIAADLLAQAEHGGDSIVGLLTDSEKLLDQVEKELIAQAKELSRDEPVEAVMKKGCFLVHVKSLDQGVEMINSFAPEHLSLMTRKEKTLLPKITTAGAIFVGNHAPVAVGDFLAGPSHTLPTGGAGASFSGLTVDQFQRRTSIIRMDEDAMKKSAPIAKQFAEIEGLDGHGKACAFRGEK